MESLATDNAAHFVAMPAARDNMSKKLDDLRAAARTIRQSEITTERIDVLTEAQALREPQLKQT